MTQGKLAFLARAFDGVDVPSGKGDPSVVCPKCKNRAKKKLAIRMSDDRCHCWVCGLSGRLISVLVKFKPTHVHEYVTKFAGQRARLLEAEESRVDVSLPADFRLISTLDDRAMRPYGMYLASRGLDIRDAWYFKFGVSNDSTMHRRVIMPSLDASGVTNFYTARAIDDSVRRKYMNCVAEKKAIVFNELYIDWSKELTLVEGPFDLTKCDGNATCLLGSSLSEDSRLFYQIFKHSTPIVLALDKDMIAKSWQRIARLLASYDIRVRIVDLGPFKDVGEMSRREFRARKDDATEWDRTRALLLKIKGVRS